MGYPFPVLAVGGTLSIQRGFSVHRVVTVAPGATFAGFQTRFCVAGGCGDRHGYLGVGPSVSLRFRVAERERYAIGLELTGGATLAVARERMRFVQPHIEALALSFEW